MNKRLSDKDIQYFTPECLDLNLNISAELPNYLGSVVEKNKKIDLNFFLARYLCGNGCLDSFKGVSRKQLLLLNSGIGYKNIAAELLSKQIERYCVSHHFLIAQDFIHECDLLAVHKALTPQDTERGKFRRIQNWVGEGGILNATRLFPPPNLLPKLISNFFDFINHSNVPNEVRVIESHCQLLAIHPFLDGNGRLSRCILGAMVFKYFALDINPVLYRLVSGTGSYIKSINDDSSVEERYRYWCDGAEWSNTFRLHINKEITFATKMLQERLILQNISTEAHLLIKFLWQQPIISRRKCELKFNWSTHQANSVLREVCKLRILTSYNVKAVPGKVIFECKDIVTAMLNIDNWLANQIHNHR